MILAMETRRMDTMTNKVYKIEDDTQTGSREIKLILSKKIMLSYPFQRRTNWKALMGMEVGGVGALQLLCKIGFSKIH